MIRVLLLNLIGFLVLCFWQVFVASFNFLPNMFFLPPLVVLCAIRLFSLNEIIVTCLITGLITDALGGLVIGPNIIVMILIVFGFIFGHRFFKNIHRFNLFFTAMTVSFMYRVVFYCVVSIFFDNTANFFIWSFIVGPIIDSIMSVIFFNILIKLFVRFKLLDSSMLIKIDFGNEV